MAGDDLQLRPKAEEYKLSVESGNGYDLTLSLFERLRGQGFPVQMLLSQRRMQPNISELIRNTVYPDLQVLQNIKLMVPGYDINMIRSISLQHDSGFHSSCCSTVMMAMLLITNARTEHPSSVFSHVAFSWPSPNLILCRFS